MLLLLLLFHNNAVSLRRAVQKKKAPPQQVQKGHSTPPSLRRQVRHTQKCPKPTSCVTFNNTDSFSSAVVVVDRTAPQITKQLLLSSCRSSVFFLI